MNQAFYTEFLECPRCHASLRLDGTNILSCCNGSCAEKYAIIGGIPNFLDPHTEKTTELSIGKWDTFYSDIPETKDVDKLYSTYLKDNYTNVYEQIAEFIELDENTVFLEIGCGPMFLGRALADKCKMVVGIDFSISALLMAKNMFDSLGITNYLLILGDIKKMPLKAESIDLLYGGGVLEHFKETEKAVSELYRVLKKGGVSFNTVPLLNIGSLTYRQLWGNIPNFPVLKEIAELIHTKILKSKHMVFGYELSFTAPHLKKIHKKYGFSEVVVEKFKTTLLFEFIPFVWLKNIFIWLAENSPLFWPMVKVVGRKS